MYALSFAEQYEYVSVKKALPPISENASLIDEHLDEQAEVWLPVRQVC